MFRFCYGALTAATVAAIILPASAQQTPAPATPPAAAAASDSSQPKPPAGAFSYIVNLKNGETVKSPFKVVFGLSPNMGIAPAGVDKENVGHHHLIIDTKLKPEEIDQPIPMDAQHLHFGKGQTEAMVTLPPGKHTLQLVLANWSHIPFSPPVQSEIITVTVKGEAAAKPSAANDEKATRHHRHRHYHSQRYMREHYVHS